MRVIWIMAPLVWLLVFVPACRDGNSSVGSTETICADGVDNDGDGDVDCDDAECVDAPECVTGFVVTLYSEDLRQRGVDMLLVLDNSGATADTREKGRMAAGIVLRKLRELEDGVPDLHLGVVTTDLGAGGNPLNYCEGAGDGGNLVTDNCALAAGAPFIVDARPQGCVINRTQAGECSSHDCTQANCDQDPSTTLEEDAWGCPRCRNFTGQSLGGILDCIGELDNTGCGFEQPLEAMFRALDNNPNNAGFLREDAHLVVVVAVDEDDCSASDPYLFDMTDTSMDSELGPLTGYRCFEWGVTCDIDDRDHVGLRENCTPREDPEALLHPIHRYTQLLRGLKWEEDVTVAVLAGPVEDDAVWVELDMEGFPELGSAVPCDEARPAVRLKAFAKAMSAPQDWWWAFTPECSGDLQEPLEAAGARVLDALGDDCAPAPPLGCSDVAVDSGLPGDGLACNDECRPSCVVRDVLNRGTLQETEAEVPHCLEVCPTGPCPGNTDRTAAYESGHPASLDGGLPVPACWQVSHEPLCHASNGAKMMVSRREEMPPRSMTYLVCDALATTEMHCTDGEDNDGDCLIDAQDPDCGG